MLFRSEDAELAAYNEMLHKMALIDAGQTEETAAGPAPGEETVGADTETRSAADTAAGRERGEVAEESGRE